MAHHRIRQIVIATDVKDRCPHAGNPGVKLIRLAGQLVAVLGTSINQVSHVQDYFRAEHLQLVHCDSECPLAFTAIKVEKIANMNRSSSSSNDSWVQGVFSPVTPCSNSGICAVAQP